MERVLILLVAALMLYAAPGVQGTAHLSFANNSEVSITRTGCGVTKLCVETPDDCDPAGNTNCLFTSVTATPPVAPNGTQLSVELRGDSTGYIALGLTVDASEGTTMLFICAQNNGTFFFRTMQRNNSNTDAALTPTETIVNEIRGMLNGSVIKCEFNVPNVNATSTRSSHSTTFSLLLGTGPVNGNTVGPFTVRLNSGPLDVTNPASNITATAAPISTAMTTSGASAAVHNHAVLLLLSVLTLSVMLRA